MQGPTGPQGATGATGPVGAGGRCFIVDPVVVASGDTDFLSPAFVDNATNIIKVAYWSNSGSADVELRYCATAMTLLARPPS